jgi:hypothetical protein
MHADKRETIGTFQAQLPDGSPVTLVVWQNWLLLQTHGDGEQWMEGTREIETASGDSVHRIDRGDYILLPSGKRLTSADPQAA